jgi:hypothetical protein
MRIVDRAINLFLKLGRGPGGVVKPAVEPHGEPEVEATPASVAASAHKPARGSKRALVRSFLVKSHRRVMARIKQPGGHARGR